MEWIANPSVGDWIGQRLDPGYATMHGVVPRGFPAYARIFHRPTVRALPERPVPSTEEWERMPEHEQHRLLDAFVDAESTWAEAAADFGTTLHPLAQWHRIVRTPQGEDWRSRISPSGREVTAPLEGELDRAQLARVAAVLAAHTTTPDAGVAALWEGYGGLLGFFGHSPSRAFFPVDDDPHHRAMLDRSTHDPFNNVFRKRTWQEGILSREISEGPRLQLPGRGYVLFSAAPRAFADPDWILDAAWRDRMAEEHGFAPSAQAPNILWPDDRAWIMASDIDVDSTIVGGSAALITALCATEGVEALAVPEGADLTWDADEVNR